ncbi:MAG: LuxR C-terminal-related transcriptional regulator [Omnitrophica WOR_2 bacterium]
MDIPLLRTKFYIPPLQPGLVHRPRLTRQINESLARKLTLISAPAGFGKTTLLSEWIPTSRRRVAWLSLEEADNDPVRFWAYVVAALQVLQEDLAKVAQAYLHAEGQKSSLPHLEAFITILINDLSDYPEEFALVFDDYQQIHNQTIHEGMNFLIDHLPPKMHILLTCRADPPLPLARLRARGEMVELRAEDLRFITEEVVYFLNESMKLNLSTMQIAALEARTEGWIAGLQLFAISMQKHQDTSDFIKSFTGSHRFILDYLVDEVLCCQPEDIQAFLLQTSILERFTGPLCNSVTGKYNGQEMLEQLEQANLFTIPLDNERRWYRYHHLFADLLRSRLQESQPDLVRVLHQRASEWLAQEGLLPEAIRHAMLINDFERSARLIEQAIETQRQQGEIATLTSWMNRLPISIRRSHPALCLAYARALVDTAQNLTIENLIADAEAGLETVRPPDGVQPASLWGQIAALRAYLTMIRHQYDATIELSRQAREFLGEEEILWRSFVGLILAGAYRFSNDWAAASQTYQEASDLSLAAGDKVNALLALSLRGEVLQAQGHLHQAADQYERILQLAQELGVPQAPVTGYALIGLGRAWCEWNDLDMADHYTRDGIEFGRKADIQDILLRGYLVLARIRQARADFAGALDALDNAEPAARQMGMAELKDWIQAQRVQVWQARGETEAAIRWAASYMGELHDKIYPSIAISLAKVKLSQGHPQEALELLDHALRSAQAVGRLGNAAQILIVKARVHWEQGELGDARATLLEVLTFAAPEGYIRIFLDEAESMQALLADFRSWIGNQPRQVAKDHQKTLLNYVDLLLNAFRSSPTSHFSIPMLHSLQTSLPEPLSERELIVLRLMAAGLSNRDIAEQDVVSINTVKTQVKSIFGKLGVHNRKDAVTTARELGLLSFPRNHKE